MSDNGDEGRNGKVFVMVRHVFVVQSEPVLKVAQESLGGESGRDEVMWVMAMGHSAQIFC